MQKVLALAGSPRKRGNSDLLLDEVLKALTNQDVPTEKIYLCDLNIGGCIHCDYCYVHDKCSINDDMSVLYGKLRETNYLLFASPLFFLSMPSQAKAVIDRCQLFWSMKYIQHKKVAENTSPRRGIFIGVAGQKSRHLFDGIKATMKYVFDALDMEYYDNFLVNNTDSKGEVTQMAEVLREAHELGEKIAAEIKAQG
ncbi:MAG: flavodoxin family protein [Phycisphaerae bacterium]|nr:flavodoxin family protein [Phycisphaerae bacterium]